MADVIRIDGELGHHNARLLREVAGELPERESIETVVGNSNERTAKAFTDHLQSRATGLADEIQKIRDYVTYNADALSQAVASLVQRDELSASEASSLEALIDQAAENSSTLMPSASVPDATSKAFGGQTR